MLLHEITGVFSLTSLLLQLRHPAVESSRSQENKVHKDAGLGRKGGRMALALPLAPRFRLRPHAALQLEDEAVTSFLSGSHYFGM